MVYWDSWTKKDFHEELIMIMNDNTRFDDVNTVLDIETRLIEKGVGGLTEDEKKQIAYGNIKKK